MVRSLFSIRGILLFIPIVLCLTQCKKEQSVEQQVLTVNESQVVLTANQAKNLAVQTTELKDSLREELLTLRGIVERDPSALSAVGSPVSGTIERLGVRSGTYVKRGQVLATIQSSEIVALQQSLKAARQNVSFAKNDYERQKYLNSYQASSEKTLQKSYAALTEAQAQYQSLQGQLRTQGAATREGIAELKAPRSGYITEVSARIGSFVMPGDPIVAIGEDTQQVFSFYAYEKSVEHIVQGQKVHVYSLAPTNRSIEATVQRIQPDMVGGAYKIYCTTGSSPALKTGSYVRGEVQISKARAYLLPSSAVVSWEGKTYVFLSLGKNLYEMYPVRTSGADQIWIEVFQPSPKLLRSAVVSRGAYDLLMALKNTEE